MNKTVATLLGILGLIAAMVVFVLLWWVQPGVVAPLPDQRVADSSTPAEVVEAQNSPLTKSAQAPDWVGAQPRLVGDAYQMSIVGDPYTTRAECDAHLPDSLRQALDRYVEVCLGEHVAERIDLPDDFLRKLVKDQWEEVRQYSIGPMVRLHVLLEFDRIVKQRVLDELRQSQVAGRLRCAWGAWAGWLALLGIVYGVLRISGRNRIDPAASQAAWTRRLNNL